MGLQRTRSIHIAPQGYETKRVYEPAITYDADLVVLVSHNEESEKGKKCEETILRRLEDQEIQCESKECDIFDLYDALETIAAIVQEYSSEDVFVNISTGSKITAIAGMLACMGSGAQPYYVKATGYKGETITTGVGEPIELAAHPIGIPDRQYLEVLHFISDSDSPKKKEVIKFASDRDLELLSGYNRDEEKNMYPPLNKEIIEPLKERGYIQESTFGQGKELSLTEHGEGMLEAMEHLIPDLKSRKDIQSKS